jgi:hypothetical protein
MVGDPPLLSATLAVWINHEKVYTPCHFSRSLPMSFLMKPAVIVELLKERAKRENEVISF